MKAQPIFLLLMMFVFSLLGPVNLVAATEQVVIDIQGMTCDL